MTTPAGGARCRACGAEGMAGVAFCGACGAAQAVPVAGRRVGSYTLRSIIQEGGMGVVYRAHDERLDRTVALKLLRDEFASDDSFRQRFVRESRAAASIDHPHILPVFDAGEVDGELYIATRLVEGSDLRTALRDGGRLSIERAMIVCGQIAQALDAAHLAGLVHRDVKPANILLAPGEHDHAYLIDFGITRSHHTGDPGLTLTGHFVGTPEYVSPEQVGEQDVDGRADQYALACVLYHCLTGQAPFGRASAVDVLHAHLYRHPPRVGDLRPDVTARQSAAVERALSKTPDERFDTCAQFIAAARGAAAAASTVTVPAAHAIEPRLPARPPLRAATVAPAGGAEGRGHRVLIVGAVLLLAMAGAGIGVLLGQSPGDDDTLAATTPASTKGEATPPGTQATATAPSPPRAPLIAVDVADLELSPRELGRYTVGLPAAWELTREEEAQSTAGNVTRTRTEAVDGDRSLSIVIDHLRDYDLGPRENRAFLDRAYRTEKRGYRRIGFEDLLVRGRNAAEWRYRYASKAGREARRVDVLLRIGDHDFAVLAGGRASYDDLSAVARAVAQSLMVSTTIAPGRYEGSGRAVGAAGSTAIVMTFPQDDSASPTVEYPDEGCSGTLEPEDGPETERRYIERILDGACEDGGRWTIDVRSDTRLRGLFRVETGDEAIRATLLQTGDNG